MTPYKSEIAVTTAFLFLISAGVIWIRTANVKTTYEFVRREAAFREEKKNEQELRIQWSKISAPHRLRKLSDQIGMTAPKLNQIYRYHQGKVPNP